MNLLENTYKSGKDLGKFLKELKEFSGQTKTLELNTSHINLFTISKVNSTGVSGFLHTQGAYKKQFKIPLSDMYNKIGATDELLEELDAEESQYSPLLMVNVQDKWFYVADYAMNTLAQRAGCVKSKTFMRMEGTTRFHRDGLMEAGLFYKPSAATMVYRKDGNAKKLFALFSTKYCYIDQYDLTNKIVRCLEEKLGQAQGRCWEINHVYTDSCIEFPEYGEALSMKYGTPDMIIPGIHLHTSDVGESSILVNGTFRIGNNFAHIPGCQVRQEHEVKLEDEEDIFFLIKNRIIPQFEETIKKLADLATIQTPDPDMTVQEVFDFCDFKRSTCLGTKGAKTFLRDNMLGRLDENSTAYDIIALITEVLSMSELKGSAYRTRDAIRDAIANSLLFSFAF